MVSLINRTIKSIIRNYTSHEMIVCDDKDPPWFNNNIKQLLQEKKNTYKNYILSDKNPQIFDRVKSFQNQLKCSIEGNKKSIICVYPKNLCIQLLVQKHTGQY